MRIHPEGGQRISLRQLLPDADFLGTDDIRVGSCSCDSRHVRPGDLFVAISGSVHDGHDFAAEAARRGATALLAGRTLPGIKLPVCRVPDVRRAYARLCQALVGNPSEHVCAIGVTGTNGKTTTACLIASVLSTAGCQVGLLGTLGGFDGLDFHGSSLTTPPPHELAAWLARTVLAGCSHAVLEVSSHALDQSRIAGITLDAACVTNVRRDHLDYHRSLLDYRMTKSRLLDYLSGEGFAVLNADDPTSASYLAEITGPVLTVGIRSAAEISARLVEQYVSEQTFLLIAGSETIPVRTRMIGTHHVYNCLIAAAVGLAYGVDLVTVVKGLEAVEHVPGRLERIECGQPFGVFVDYAHTPDALTSSLRTLREVVGGRLICVFGAGGDRDKEKRPLMARAVEEEADLAILTNDNPRTEDPEAIHHDVLRGFQRLDEVQLIPDRAAAICRALGQAGPGDCVLIAGKGHEKHQVIGRERIPFDDREVARAWLYQMQPVAVSAE
jgi:UDP-N-acetylmuramoyl-L-alanyl-D-glutamate--2,6-diaminopimelate ligase